MAIIEFDGVWKRYLRGELRKDVRSVVSTILPWIDPGDDVFWALRDVSFEVKRGETLGIIGANGAGKTTILKLLAGITAPNRGEIRTEGRIAALINLGAGFHRELTGRENILLNGVILGMSRKEIEAKLDDIIAFAELEDAIDTPVKRYSAGMYARLGFSIAVHVEPDILLVDEVLSVGDQGFRAKSTRRMAELRDEDRAIVFVSHNLWAVEWLCDRVIWLDNGQIMAEGDATPVIKQYLEFFDRKMVKASKEELQRAKVGSGEIVVEQVILRDASGNETDVFTTGDDIIVELVYNARERVEAPKFSIGISDGRGSSIIGASMLQDGQYPDHVEGRGCLRCIFRSVPLAPRTYQIYCSIAGEATYDYMHHRYFRDFQIVGDGWRSSKYEASGSHGGAPVRVPYEWQFASNSMAHE